MEPWRLREQAKHVPRRADACPHSCAQHTEPLRGANAECEFVRDNTLSAGKTLLAMKHSNRTEEALERAVSRFVFEMGLKH